MSKPTIFLSHITEERDLAVVFKSQIENSFLGLVNVFQSTDPASVVVGQNWLNNITNALTQCEVILLFCSPESIQRPWINFECGAGWGRQIEVVPLCHSGMRPVALPVPISLLQGVQANQANELQQIFDLIAKKLGASAPKIDIAHIAKSVSEFENHYMITSVVTRGVAEIKAAVPGSLAVLAKVPANMVMAINGFPERYVERLRTTFDALQKAGVFSYSYQGMGMSFGGPHAGPMGDLTVKIAPELMEAIKKATRA